MKYMQEGGFQKHPLMRMTITLTLLFFLGLWISNFLMYFSRMNLSTQSVTDYYLGSEETFRPARSYQSMLEVTHFHLPIMAIVLLLMTHLLIFAPFKNKIKTGFIVVAFSSAATNEAAGWLVRFVNPVFAYLKIGSFLTLQGVLGFLIAGLFWFLYLAPQNGD